MDPNETLRRIGDSRRASGAGRRECRELMAALAHWLSRGGFAPNWKAHPEGTARFSRAHPAYAPREKGSDVLVRRNVRIYRVRWLRDGRGFVNSNINGGLVATFSNGAWDTLGRLPDDVRIFAEGCKP